MGERTRIDELPEGSLKTAIQHRLESFDSGSTRVSNRNFLGSFAEWLVDERGITEVENVDVIDCRRYAQHLRRRIKQGDLSVNSAGRDGPYFTYVRAFLEWCVKDELLDQNPAKPNRVQDVLPTSENDADRQFWTTEKREAMFRFLDERVDRALDEGAPQQRLRTVYRNRALVYLLGLTGVRGAEILRHPRDRKRDGLRWADVDTDRGVITVYGKAREHQPAQVPDAAARRLERYYRVAEPGTDRWPVFPTNHFPTLSRKLRDAVGDGRADALIEEHGIREALIQADVEPPALSTDGARDVLKKLCEMAGVEIDGEYMKPHGARRGLGHQLYTEGSAELAQDVLRHTDITVTHESYKEARVEETKQMVEDVLGGDE